MWVVVPKFLGTLGGSAPRKASFDRFFFFDRLFDSNGIDSFGVSFSQLRFSDNLLLLSICSVNFPATPVLIELAVFGAITQQQCIRNVARFRLPHSPTDSKIITNRITVLFNKA